MGQLRMALRAYALEEESPAEVVRRVHILVRRLVLPEIVTLLYLVYDPETGAVRFANAGHPPPLVVSGADAASYLEGRVGPPLGAVPYSSEYADSEGELGSGSTLFLFTDGLIEKRGVSIQDGLTRLRAAAAKADGELDSLCDRLVDSMIGGQTSDDVALLALRPVPLSGDSLKISVPAEPYVLPPLRQTLRRWLREVDALPQEANDITVACGEACTNVIQHAYGAREGLLDVDLVLRGRTVDVTVRDRGSWRPTPGRDGGRGLDIMHGFMDTVDVDRGESGTTVRMKRRLRNGRA
jgi:anti-sigma regulatory factor (Ser/Thr protein kinase)